MGAGKIVVEDYEDIDVKLDYTGGGNAISGLDRFGRVVDQIWDRYGANPAPLDEYVYEYDRAGNRTRKYNALNSDLEPYASRIIVLTNRKLPARPAGARDATLPQAIDLSGGWNVSFGKHANPVVMDKLHSWTDDERTRYFSGVAVYEKKFTVPPEMFRDGLALDIALGESRATASGGGRGSAASRDGSRMQALLDAPLREAAVVFVNGKRAAAVWCPPYRVDVTGLLKSGENQLRIEVANLAVNCMADFKNHPLPDYSALIARFGDRFQAQDMDQIRPIPSGLMGPIQLIATEKRPGNGGPATLRRIFPLFLYLHFMAQKRWVRKCRQPLEIDVKFSFAFL
jgi:hypothetical protein